jgi:hypothetical protein
VRSPAEQPILEYRSPSTREVARRRTVEEEVALENLLITVFVFLVLLGPAVVTFVVWKTMD